MRNFDYITNPAKLLTPEIVQMVGSIHEHKGKQELFLEANIDELKTLLEVALIQSTGASNRIEGIFTSDKRLEELVSQKAEPRNRSEQEIAGSPEAVFCVTAHASYLFRVHPALRESVSEKSCTDGGKNPCENRDRPDFSQRSWKKNNTGTHHVDGSDCR